VPTWTETIDSYTVFVGVKFGFHLSETPFALRCVASSAIGAGGAVHTLILTFCTDLKRQLYCALYVSSKLEAMAALDGMLIS
jgi:hypothetical protein